MKNIKVKINNNLELFLLVAKVHKLGLKINKLPDMNKRYMYIRDDGMVWFGKTKKQFEESSYNEKSSEQLLLDKVVYFILDENINRTEHLITQLYRIDCDFHSLIVKRANDDGSTETVHPNEITKYLIKELREITGLPMLLIQRTLLVYSRQMRQVVDSILAIYATGGCTVNFLDFKISDKVLDIKKYIPEE